MPDAATLVQMRNAVVEDPYDDRPRLVYADALDEAGGADDAAYASFIRDHVRLCRIGPKRRRIQTPLNVNPGEDSFWFVADEDHGLHVGDRVDVGQIKPGRGRKRDRLVWN